MEIISKLVKIKAKFPPDNNYIEKELKKAGIIPLRWAIVDTNNEEFIISLACENL